MPGNGKGSSWRHCRLMTSRHATWSCLLSVSNALSIAYLFVSITCFNFSVSLRSLSLKYRNKTWNIGLTIPGNWSFEIRWISPVKSVWNPVDFTREIRTKSAGFHGMWAFAWWSSIGLSFERPNKSLVSINFQDQNSPRKTTKTVVILYVRVKSGTCSLFKEQNVHLCDHTS